MRGFRYPLIIINSKTEIYMLSKPHVLLKSGLIIDNIRKITISEKNSTVKIWYKHNNDPSEIYFNSIEKIYFI